MKNILINIIIIIMSLIIPSNVYALSTSQATEEIDITQDCSLALNYEYDGYNFDNTTVKIYYIASITSDFQYQLSSDFLKYPIEINGITTEDKWISLEQTLNSYIEADKIKETLAQTVKNNTIKFSNLNPGLYFIKIEKIDTKDYSLIFDSLLLSIPNLEENGTWNYNVSVNPKIEEYTPKYDKINYTVLKEWIDNPNTRPSSIDIEIYEDGLLVDSQVLSSSNNWTYTWTTDDDGSTWTVVERNIKPGYTVSISNQSRNFIIVNKDTNYQEENPYTIDNINLYFYLLIVSIIGIILLITSFFIQKKTIK